MGDGGYDHPATYDAVKNHTNRQEQDSPKIIIPPNTGFQAIQDDYPEQRTKILLTNRGDKNGKLKHITEDEVVLKTPFQDLKPLSAIN